MIGITTGDREEIAASVREITLFTLRRQIIATMHTSIDDIKARHWKHKLCIVCKIANVLVQRDLPCLSSSLSTENQSATHPAGLSKACAAIAAAKCP